MHPGAYRELGMQRQHQRHQQVAAANHLAADRGQHLIEALLRVALPCRVPAMQHLPEAHPRRSLVFGGTRQRLRAEAADLLVVMREHGEDTAAEKTVGERTEVLSLARLLHADAHLLGRLVEPTQLLKREGVVDPRCHQGIEAVRKRHGLARRNGREHADRLRQLGPAFLQRS